MARGKQNTNLNDNGENDFKVETIISRLDRIHHVLKEVEEIKDSLVCMAKQRAEVELKMLRKDEELTRARKKIEDLNKENEELKGGTRLRRCSLEFQQMPLSEIQQGKNSAEPFSKPQPEMQIVSSTPKTGQQNSGDCQFQANASKPVISSGDVIPESMDYLPVFKTEDKLLHAEDYGCLEVAGPSTDVVVFSGAIQKQQERTEELTVQAIKEEQIDSEDCTDEEILGPDCTDHLSLQDIEDQDSAAMTIYQCDVCQARFVRLNLLQVHRRHHGDRTGLKRHKCTQCAYSTDRTSSLENHLRTHTKEKPYACDMCRRAFNQKSHLTVHMKMHTKEKPYACDMCRRAFNQKSNLSVHMKMHTKEKPYACDLCHKTFALRHQLLRHQKNMHTKE